MKQNSPSFPRAGFFRRAAAMLYDALVAIAIGMIAAMLLIVPLVVLIENGILDKQGFQYSNEVIQHSLLYKSLIQVWVVFWVTLFFLWFWRNGGQTLGMRAWRLRLFSLTDEPVGYKRAFVRLLCSVGGLGTLLVLLDWRHKQSLQDRIAHTEMLVLTKDANHHKSWKNI